MTMKRGVFNVIVSKRTKCTIMSCMIQNLQEHLRAEAADCLYFEAYL